MLGQTLRGLSMTQGKKQIPLAQRGNARLTTGHILQVAVPQEHRKAITLTLTFATSHFQHYSGETEGKPCLG